MVMLNTGAALRKSSKIAAVAGLSGSIPHHVLAWSGPSLSHRKVDISHKQKIASRRIRS